MAISNLFSGVQAIHSNNNTYTTREGYVSDFDLKEMISLTYSSGREYSNLAPGMYRITIDGEIYIFLLHDTLSGSDKLVIDNQYNAYTIISSKKESIILYKANNGKIIQTRGNLLPHTVNDYLDMLVMDGITNFTTDGEVSLTHPGKLEYISMISIKITDENDNAEEYLFNMKAYLKGLNNIHDTLYLDSANNKALFCFKLGRIVFTGSEIITEVPEYSNNTVGVYFYSNPLVKQSGDLICTHLPVITWSQMKNTSYTNSGVCSGAGIDQGFYFKIPRTVCADAQAFKDIITEWYTMTTEELDTIRDAEYSAAVDKKGTSNGVVRRITINSEFTITYELHNQQFKHVALDSYKIPTFYNTSWIICTPYKNPNITYIRQSLSNIMGLVPKNGIMKSIIEQMEESGDPASYQKILNENRIIRNITTSDAITDYSNSFMSIIDSTTVAVLPKNGVIKSAEAQEQESGRADKYSQILDENIIWRNLIVTGDINIRAMYFYKHLRLT